MVCIYCAGKTEVINSRPSKRYPGTWRRRQCTQCNQVFTSREHADLSGTHVVTRSDTSIEPFSRDNLFISIHRSCGHRKTALEDATALIGTVISTLLRIPHENGTIDVQDIKKTCKDVLKNFDTTAATYYTAYYG